MAKRKTPAKVVLGICATLVLWIISIYLGRLLPTPFRSTSVYYILTGTQQGKEILYCRKGSQLEIVAYNPDTHTKPIPSSGKYLGTVYNGDTGQLYVLSADFKPEKKLITSAVSDSWPLLLPDGKTVLFTRASLSRTDSFGGHQWTDFDLFSVGLDGKRLTRLTSLVSRQMSRPVVTLSGDKAASDKRSNFAKDMVFTVELVDSKPIFLFSCKIGAWEYIAKSCWPIMNANN
jgi:hypothetical protein